MDPIHAKGPRAVATDEGLESFQRAGGAKESTQGYSAPEPESQVVPFHRPRGDPLWSPDQERALADIKAWRRSGGRLFKLWGFAGTGKSTLLAHLAREIPDVVVLCVTNKACTVLKAMGIEARTLHSFCYEYQGSEADRLKARIETLKRTPPSDRAKALAAFSELAGLEARLQQLLHEALLKALRPTGEQFFDAKEPDGDYRLIILDESSMVNEEHAARVMSFDIPVLSIGDPFQLPPVPGIAPFVMGQPDAMLREIHRQAEGHPIIRMSRDVREKGLRYFAAEYGASEGVRIIQGEADDEALGAEQIICGTHKRRRHTNRVVRELRGFSGEAPMIGERLLCKSNSRHGDERGLSNGEIFIVETGSGVTRDFGDIWWKGDVRREGSGEIVEVTADLEMLTASAGDGTIAVDQTPPPGCDELHFGYAVTCHAAQGSQWDSVTVFDEAAVFHEHALRWLYTSITRAAKELTLVVRGRRR